MKKSSRDDGELPVVDKSGETLARLDTTRVERCGAPEAVFALRKTAQETVAITDALMKKQGHVLVTRANEETIARLKKKWPRSIKIASHAGAALIGKVPVQRDISRPVALVAAGTSDLSVLEEAELTLESLGIPVRRVVDVGVAGIHRLFGRLEELRGASVIIAIAGMEGALPSVLAGLVSNPVIAVPTSVGYGASFAGISALLGMLNSCSPGITVVNIDNGFGAAVAAARMIGMSKYAVKR